MSEEGYWNGIPLASIRTAYFQNIVNALATVQRLIDSDAGVDYRFDTETNGSVIIDDNYLTWEFVAPDDYGMQFGDTVADIFTNLESKVTNDPVTAWEDFAGFLSDQRATINDYLTEGDSATITDVQGNTYAGTVHQVPAFNNFADVVVWLRSWLSSEMLAAPSSVVMLANNLVGFALTSGDTTIRCGFQF